MEFRVTSDQVVAFKACDEATVSVLPAAPDPSPASAHARCGQQRREPAQLPMLDEAWMVEFEKQDTDQLRRWLLRYAKKRADMVVQYGGRIDPSVYARELVDDVFTDILTGRLTWRARPRSLWKRAFRAIQSRSRDERKRAKGSSHVSLELSDEETDAEHARELMREAEEALAAMRATPAPEVRFFVADVVARLRKLARGDDQVLALIDAMVAEATERSDLMQALGMDEPTYARVRRRFDRLVRKLQQGA